MLTSSRNRKSIFLNRPDISDGAFATSVLIIGGDWIGAEIERRLSQLGLEVTMASGVSKSKALPEQDHLILDSIEGHSGQFQAKLIKAGESVKKMFGFVIAAQPGVNEPRFQRYGLRKGPKVVSLSEFSNLLESGEFHPKAQGKWFHAAFVDDLIGDSGPETLGKFLDIIEKLSGIENLQSYVFTRHLKVAGPCLEKRYREARRGGAIFFRFDDSGPEFEYDSDTPRIIFTDPLLRLDFELTPDIIVIDETLCPPVDLSKTFGMLAPLEMAHPYLQSESPRFNGVLTSKDGLFAAGPSRGVFGRDRILDDIEAVESEIRKSLLKLELSPEQGPVIDKSKCAFCLTCIRLCPHGAITFHDRAHIISRSCFKCGICVAECPMQAISFSEEPEGLDKLVGASKNTLITGCSGKIAAFLCSRSAAQAFKAIEFIYKDDVAVFEINCAGSLEPQRILDAFRNGASAVLVGGCFKGNCASVYGNILCGNRVDRIADTLWDNMTDNSRLTESTVSAGVPKMDRLRFVHTAGNTPDILAKAIFELKKQL